MGCSELHALSNRLDQIEDSLLAHTLLGFPAIGRQAGSIYNRFRWSSHPRACGHLFSESDLTCYSELFSRASLALTLTPSWPAICAPWLTFRSNPEMT